MDHPTAKKKKVYSFGSLSIKSFMIFYFVCVCVCVCVCVVVYFCTILRYSDNSFSFLNIAIKAMTTQAASVPLGMSSRLDPQAKWIIAQKCSVSVDKHTAPY